jgi:hypothetical protein
MQDTGRGAVIEVKTGSQVVSVRCCTSCCQWYSLSAFIVCPNTKCQAPKISFKRTVGYKALSRCNVCFCTVHTDHEPLHRMYHEERGEKDHG